ncbi:MAG: hypothetical protein ACE5R6_11110 [Candidatus Heimdallarchaeota archaeon]
MGNTKAFFYIIKLEIYRIFRSSRFLVIFLASILPMFLYLDLFARQQSVAIALFGETWFKIRSLQVFVFFTPFLSEVIAILLVADLLGGEKRSALMVLFSTSSSRLITLLAKFAAAMLLTTIGVFSSLVAFDLLLIMWGAPLPALSSQLLAFTIVLLASLLAASITLCTTSFLIAQEKGTAVGALIPIFIFFVLSFIIESSIRFGFIDSTMLKYTFLQQFIEIQRYFFFLNAEQTSLSVFYSALGIVSLTIVASVLLAIFVVQKLEF